jgi:hypothetical protein
MMTGDEIKARVSIEDHATGELVKIQRELGNLRKSVESLSNGSRNLSTNFSGISGSSPFKKIGSDIDRASNSFREFNSTLNSTVSVWSRAFKEELGRGLVSAFGTALTSSFNLAKSIETNSVGIAGILTSAYKLNGKQMEWNDALNVSRTIINDLSKDALATSASVGELVETFRALLGPAGQAGMSISQIENLSVVGTNAVKSLGLGPDQYVQELRDLVQGGIRPSSSTLATSLGITDTDIKNAKNSSEGLYNFLMDKMKGFKIASEKTADTVQGAYDQITESVTYGVMQGQQSLFNYIRDNLNEVKNSIIFIDDKTKKVTINPQLLKDTERISNGLMDTAETIKAFGKNGGLALLSKTVDIGAGAFERYSKWLVPLLSFFAVKKAWGTFKDVSNAGKDINYKPKTFAGGLWQDVKEFHYGKRHDIARVSGIANDFSEGMNYIDKQNQKQQQMDSFLNSNRNSIRNLADEWERMGVNAETAMERASRLGGIDTGTDKGIKLFQKLLDSYDNVAQEAEKTRQVFVGQADALRDVVAQEKQREALEKRFESLFKGNIRDAGERAHGHTPNELNKAYVSNFIGDKDNGKGATLAEKYANDLKRLGFEENQVNEYTRQFIQATKGLKGEKLDDVYKKATEEAQKYKDMLSSIKDGISPSDLKINTFLGDSSTTQAQADAVRNLQSDVANGFKGVENSAERASEYVSTFIDSLKGISADNVEGINRAYKQAENGIKTYVDQLKKEAEVQGLVRKAEQEVAKGKKRTADMTRLEELKTTALANAQRIGGAKAVDAVKKVIKVHEDLQKALKNVGGETKQVAENEVKYLGKVATATKSLDTALDRNQQKIVENANESLRHSKALDKDALSAGKLFDKTGALITDVGILSGIIADVTGKSDSWASTLADDAFQAGMVMSALSNISKAVWVDLLPAIAKATEALVGFATEEAVVAVIANPLLAVGALVTGAAAAVMYETKGKQLDAEWRKKHPNANMWGVDNTNKSDPYSNNSSYGLQFASDTDYTKYIKNGKIDYDALNRDKKASVNAQIKAENTPKTVDTSKVTGNTVDVPDTPSKKKAKKETSDKIKSVTQEITAGIKAVRQAHNDMAQHVMFGYKGCARFISSLYKQYGLTSENVDVLVKQAGNAVHKFDGTQKLEAGDIIVYGPSPNDGTHVALYDGNGHTIASDSHNGVDRGVRQYGVNSGVYGKAQWYISARELSGDAKFDVEMTEQEQKQYEHLQEIQDKINDLNSGYKDIVQWTAELTGNQHDYLDELMDGTDKIEELKGKVAELEHTMGNDGKPVIDSKKYVDAIEQARKALYHDVQDKLNQETEENTERELEKIKISQQLGYMDTEEQQNILRDRLAKYEDFLRDELQDDQLASDRKAEIEQKLAQTISDLNDAKRTNAHTFTQAILADYEAMSINYADYAEDVLGTIESAGVSLLSSFDNIHTKIKAFFSDVTKSILENMSKIIMKGIMMNSVLSIFGKSTGNSDFFGIHMGKDLLNGGSLFDFDDRNPLEKAWDSVVNIPTIKPHANGGIASGLSIVGENGAELVDFKNPARVYSHNESKKLIGGGNVNVKLDIHNESGVPVTAESQGTTFDGEQYVMSVVLKGIANNTMGSRTILKTLAQGG